VGRRRGQSKLKPQLYRLATPNLPIAARHNFRWRLRALTWAGQKRSHNPPSQSGIAAGF